VRLTPTRTLYSRLPEGIEDGSFDAGPFHRTSFEQGEGHVQRGVAVKKILHKNYFTFFKEIIISKNEIPLSSDKFPRCDIVSFACLMGSGKNIH